MYRVVSLAEACAPPTSVERLTRWAAAWRRAHAVELRICLDEERLRDADPRLLADVGLTQEDVVRGALRGSGHR